MSQDQDSPPERCDPEIIYTDSGAAQQQPLTPSAVQGLFPNMEVLEVLGRGGMGVVYKARQTKLDRLVALKLLRPGLAQDPHFEERFLREARALARLNHPNIVSVYDFGDVDGTYFLIMEFVDGAGLRTVLNGGAMKPEQAMAIVPQICDALQFAHEHGVVHRDIKPENILLNRHGRVKIADFGLAKMLQRDTESMTLTMAGQAMGTPHYMAPEQISTPLEVDHRADLYSLGVVIYEMLTKQLPIGRFELPSAKTRCDSRLDDVVLKALESEPQRRYQHASEVKTDVEGIATSSAAIRTPAAATGNNPFAWFDKLPISPFAIAGITTAIGAVLAVVILKLGLLSNEAAAIIYPFGFLAIATMRSARLGPDKIQERIMFRVLGFALCAFTIWTLPTNNSFESAKTFLLVFAALLMVGGHLLIDRWVREMRWEGLAALVFWTLGTIAFAGSGAYFGNALSAAISFAAGVIGLQFGASVVALLPAYFIGESIPRQVHFALLRAFCVGLPIALVYFFEVV